MFPTGPREYSVKMHDDVAEVVALAAGPSRTTGDHWVSSYIPDLFNIGIDDIDALPADARTPIVEALRVFVLATGSQGTEANESRDVAMKQVRAVIDVARQKILGTVQSEDVRSIVVHKDLYGKRSHEFTGQRFCEGFGFQLQDIQSLGQQDRAGVVSSVQELVGRHASASSGFGGVTARDGSLSYPSIYAADIRQVLRPLQRVLVKSGLLSQQVMDIIVKVGHAKIRDLLVLDRNVRTPAITRAAATMSSEEATSFLAAVDAFLVEGKVSGKAAKRFDDAMFQAGVTA
jgi:hypothetical protein